MILLLLFYWAHGIKLEFSGRPALAEVFLTVRIK